MKIEKEEYQKFVEMYDNIIEEIENITKLKGIDYEDDRIDFNEDSIRLTEEVDVGCGDYDYRYHTIPYEELSMDREELIEEKKRQDEIDRLERDRRIKAQRERDQIEQRNRDLYQFNQLKKKLNL